jgi:hypothetical protein
MRNLYHEKRHAIIFSRVIEMMAEEKVLYSRRGKILLLRGLCLGEIAAIVVTKSSFPYGETLHKHLHHPQHQHRLHLVIHFIPLIVSDRSEPLITF